MVRKIVQSIFALLLTGLVVLTSWAGPVDLNSADAETIARELNGVGVSRAQAIVEYREQYGAFLSAEDLLNVTGIGPHILQVNKANIVLSQAE
jgi:competence protein ComEA